mmetsp:Transcript_346/g.855  ORF Transcript_346/g.855 Transcript_346/m.855 type:complete len:468 (-) Transcript_346:240-1643(-)
MAQKAAEAAQKRSNDETERLLTQLILQRSSALAARVGEDGVLAFCRRPVVRGRPNERFLTNTLRGVFSTNRRVDEQLMWETRNTQREREEREERERQDRRKGGGRQDREVSTHREREDREGRFWRDEGRKERRESCKDDSSRREDRQQGDREGEVRRERRQGDEEERSGAYKSGAAEDDEAPHRDHKRQRLRQLSRSPPARCKQPSPSLPQPHHSSSCPAAAGAHSCSPSRSRLSRPRQLHSTQGRSLPSPSVTSTSTSPSPTASNQHSADLHPQSARARPSSIKDGQDAPSSDRGSSDPEDGQEGDGAGWAPMSDEDVQRMLSKYRVRGSGGVGSQVEQTGPYLPPEARAHTLEGVPRGPAVPPGLRQQQGEEDEGEGADAVAKALLAKDPGLAKVVRKLAQQQAELDAAAQNMRKAKRKSKKEKKEKKAKKKKRRRKERHTKKKRRKSRDSDSSSDSSGSSGEEV